eukprot:3572260-Prymnesium_polylepis.2
MSCPPRWIALAIARCTLASASHERRLHLSKVLASDGSGRGSDCVLVRCTRRCAMKVTGSMGLTFITSLIADEIASSRDARCLDM